MDSEQILKQTRSYDQWLVERLRNDDELTREYLEAALEAYEEDGDTIALLFALRSVAEAQGRMRQLAKATGISCEHLSDMASVQPVPRLDNLLGILSGLGYRVRLQRQVSPETPHENVAPATGA